VSLRGPELLGREHFVDGFDCGSLPLNDWLTRRGLANQRNGASRSWVVVDGETGRVVAYYASATASIVRAAATRQAARNQPTEIPAVLLARLAVDREFAGRGIGASLLRHFLLKALEVAELVGVRVVLVHAENEAARDFYLHYEFESSPFDDLTLMRLISDLR
jgi:GNAT superfamily N-acetyltransferase